MTGSDTGQPGKDAGFTLVELLATLAIFSLISLVLLRSLDFGFQAWNRGKAHASRVDQVYLAQDVLRRLIEGAYPYMLGTDPTHRSVDFTGTVEQISMLASAPRALETAGRARVLLSAIRRSGSVDLVLTVSDELVHAASPSSPKVLIAGAASIIFSYLGRGRSDRDADWRGRWTGEVAPPKLVRIAVAFPAGDARTWPDLVIAPRISVDVGCTYDALTKRCRGR